MLMVRKINLFHLNFLIIAIMISLAWHLLWIAAIKIVIAPDQPAYVKFSKVSFLGPASVSGNAELRLEPKARSFLERRYRAKTENLSIDDKLADPTSYAGYDKTHGGYDTDIDEAFTLRIAKAMSSNKLEPPSNLDPSI